MDISKQTLFLTVKDHSVSRETFDLYRDDTLDLLTTYPQPDLTALPKYYESDDYISHTDGKRSLFENAYHFVKNIALKNKLNLIIRLNPEKGSLLDEKAKAIALKKGVDFVNNTSELPSHSFDVITMWHVLEHVPDLENQIIELKRLIKPEGTIIIAVPNFNSYDAKHYGSFWAAYDVPRHLWHFSKTAIQTLFAKEALQLVQTLPMKFDAFYVSLLSEKYKTGKMNFIAAFWIGLCSNWKATKNLEFSSHIYIIKNKE